MATAGGAGIVTDGLVLSLDGASRRSTLKATQVNNILPDPGNWSTGTGGQTGYSPNGSSSEQNRVSVTDDPWGRTSTTWRTTPDSTSGADGGWNSSYYSIDTNYTYRYSMWVRRYTSGTGGTFYMGMNPNPIRNDNGASQGNPYFTYPSIASLTQNQWYLVVAHVFYEGYTGGRHPESGWYENGVKISDKSFGNVGSLDVRWASGTTSARHRAYHYYTTNVNSGIEFAYPRVDKIDGKEPSISELINRGESGWLNLVGDDNGEVGNGTLYTSDNAQSSFVFDGTDDKIDIPLITLSDFTITQVLKMEDVENQMPIGGGLYSNGSDYRGYTWFFKGQNQVRIKVDGEVGPNFGVNSSVWAGKWISYTATRSGSTYKLYINGELYGTQTSSTNQYSIRTIGWGYSNSYAMQGNLSVTKIYDRALSADEVQQNYNAYKNRFNL